MRNEITREQAITLNESEFWKDLTPRQIAEFQLNTKVLCMPFGVFHEAVEEALGRPVWTQEFGMAESLQTELRGDRAAPTFAEICELIPEEKRLLVVSP